MWVVAPDAKRRKGKDADPCVVGDDSEQHSGRTSVTTPMNGRFDFVGSGGQQCGVNSYSPIEANEAK